MANICICLILLLLTWPTYNYSLKGSQSQQFILVNSTKLQPNAAAAQEKTILEQGHYLPSAVAAAAAAPPESVAVLHAWNALRGWPHFEPGLTTTAPIFFFIGHFGFIIYAFMSFLALFNRCIYTTNHHNNNNNNNNNNNHHHQFDNTNWYRQASVVDDDDIKTI